MTRSPEPHVSVLWWVVPLAIFWPLAIWGAMQLVAQAWIAWH